MASPHPNHDHESLSRAYDFARDYLSSLGERHVGAAVPVDPARRATLPSEGIGEVRAIETLHEELLRHSHASTGPRFFHYVVGGVWPAALAADWLTSTFDPMATSATGSPVAVELEEVASRWLLELFELDPDAFTGHFTTGATMANLVGLAAARQWWAEGHGIDMGEDGFGGHAPPVVLSSGFVHASARKALSILGMGRSTVRVLATDNRGTLDVDALERELDELAGTRPIVIANAGEVNAGRFDPIERIAELTAAHGAWLHVDGAFGLFARASSAARDLGRGIEHADSIASDGHKWLQVPYDCGFVFVRERGLMAKAFRMVAPYLPPGDEPGARVPGNLGPECSRRARALPVFAALLSQGREGIRAMVDGHLALAQRLAGRVRESTDLELVDDVGLNIVPFRFVPEGVRRRDLDDLNERLGRAVLRDGRVFVGTTRYRSVICFRPAVCNWRTRECDVDLLVEVVRELGAELMADV